MIREFYDKIARIIIIWSKMSEKQVLIKLKSKDKYILGKTIFSSFSSLICNSNLSENITHMETTNSPFKQDNSEFTVAKDVADV